MPPHEPATEGSDQPKPALSLLDSTSIIVGIIIGSAIYRVAPLVAESTVSSVARIAGAAHVGSSAHITLAYVAIIGVWLAGGIVALVGAMCYAELATAYPHAGGTYVYLSKAFGRTVGFAFAWCEFWIVRPGNVGAVAFVLASYGAPLLGGGWGKINVPLWLAVASIVVISLLNAIGLQVGKQTQNVLTACKVVGLCAVIIAGLSVSPAPKEAVLGEAIGMGLSLALIQVMFAYGGWADVSFVAAEVRQPERNISRALVLGTGVVTLIYVSINWAYLRALGITGVMSSSAVAADVLSLSLGNLGSRVISLLVIVSCLGAINGMLFTGARVFYALGTHHAIFRWLGAWNPKTGVPLRSLVLQTLVTLALVIGFGRNPAGFERLVVFTAPFYWGFIALVGVALIILRLRAATTYATFRVPLYPLTPIVFAVTSGAMVIAAIDYARRNLAIEAWWAVVIIGAGIVVGVIDWLSRRRQVAMQAR